jgi:hypothetical protein
MSLEMEVLKCFGQSLYLRINKKGEYYCTLFHPTNQHESFECPLLKKKYVMDEKNGYNISYWECLMKETERKDVVKWYKKIKERIQ